jgi:2,3-bisphosphoglycerate-dependent phosphoglycerate mutase
LPLGIERLVSSPFVRCLQTIRPFAERADLEVAVCEDLRERLLVRRWDDDFAKAWHRSWADFDFALPGCETSRGARRRFVGAMRGILREEEGRTIGVCARKRDRAVVEPSERTRRARDGRTIDESGRPQVSRRGDAVRWDRSFRLPGLAELATDHADTPIAGE